ncbi:MAG: amino acid adenylation domain-containing protein, partial [Halanaerobiales bacterium]|nr:amino acid adenylation domain-containing protein [Halanaerobiales bacterium]
DVLKGEYITELLKYAKVYNTYGPTESTVCATYYRCSDNKLTNIPIGKPISNYQVYVLDKYLNLCPLGVAGELCVSGDGVTRGYLNREELTNEKFIPNPFIAEYDSFGEMIYRTGDLVRWLPDENIEFLGRIDQQVKIRGYRIELGEIENQLLSLNEVKDVVIVARNDQSGNKELCAYLVMDEKISAEEIRSILLNKLPEYMIPSYFVYLDEMPLTTSGKVDRKALPKPDGNQYLGTEYVAPNNEIEEKLVDIWLEVLRVEKIGTSDNFFTLGGHSLKAIQVTSRILKEFDVDLPLIELFKTPTIKEIAEYINKTETTLFAAIERVEKREYYPASSAQKRIYALRQLEGENITYNMPTVMILEGELDKELFRDVFKKLIKHHEAFRTSFEMIDGEVVQFIHDEVEFSIRVVEADEAELDATVKSLIRPFDLKKAPLLRVEFVRFAENKYVFIVDMHHIISDGVSTANLIKDLATLFAGKELPELRLQYKDFAVWQNELFASEKIKEQEKYWLETFAGEIPVLNLQTDYLRPAVMTYEGDIFNFEIDQKLTSELNELASKNGATLFMTLLAFYNLLLAKYAGQEDIVVGTPSAGRRHSDLENIIGMFVNTLAMRNYPTLSNRFVEFLADVKENALKAYEYQDYQFEMLIDQLNLRRDMNRNPLFDTMFAMQKQDITTNSETYLTDLKLLPYKFENKTAKFDLLLHAIETNQGTRLSFTYNTNLFKEETIRRMAKHFVNIVEEVVKNPDAKMQAITMITEEEKSQLLYEFNQTNTEYPKDKVIHHLFIDQVNQTPDKNAIVFENQQLTYRELNKKSDQLAGLLRDKGVRADQIVGIMVEPGLEMFIGILGILKAGGAYLPIDAQYPVERIEYMVNDSHSNIVLTQNHLKDKLEFVEEVISLDNEDLYSNDFANIEIVNKSNDLAYVIYTSGSTGKPKGVLIEHKSLVNLTYWHINYYEITSLDCSTKYAGFGFDASVWEIFPYIISGATIHVIAEEMRLDVNKLNAYFEENQITISFLPTQLCEQFMTLKNNSLRKLLTGGDKLKFYQDTNYQLINNYGPTENTVVTTHYEVDKQYNNIPIGKPIDNTKVYILDKSDQLQPVGVPGELCISGDGLARGYLNNAELTDKKFVTNPYTGERMYRTGDLTRWYLDGNIEFLGRIDYQVKIRGFRIELGEIENRLLEHEMIRETIVIDKADQNDTKYLCAYIVTDTEISVADLRTYLAKDLPEYMIPSYFISLDKMPLTRNGKVDRKALPTPEGNLELGTEYVAPQDEAEEKMAKIWSEVLSVEKVGINDNFFELGGHSLKAIQLTSKVLKEFNVEMPLQEIFKTPTIKELVEYVQQAKKTVFTAIEPVEKREYYPVSSAQKRIYALRQLEGENITYNMPTVMILEGELDKEIFTNVFKNLIKRHEAFRTSFEMIDGELVQRIHDEVDFSITELEVTESELESTVKGLIKPFDLSKAPLLRVAMVKFAENKHVFLVDMHHIISDGVSTTNLIRDFAYLFAGYDLPNLPLQYKDFAVWQNELFASEKIKIQEQHWLETFAGEIPVLNLPTDYPRPVMKTYAGDDYKFSLDQDLTAKIKEVNTNFGSTLYMTLLAAYNVLLSKYAGQEDIVVGSPTAGRRHADLENIIGMFVNTLVMRNYPNVDKSFKTFLDEVKKNALGAFENQDYQFEMLVDQLNLPRDMSRNPLFDTMFMLHNVEDMSGSPDVKSDLKMTPYKFENKTTKFDLMFNAVEAQDEIRLTFSYNTDLFKPATIKRMSDHFVNIIREVVENPEIQIKAIDLLNEEEKNQLVHVFNQTVEEFPNEKTLVDIFEEAVERTPEKTALIFEGEELSYRQLNVRGNGLARVLREKGVQNQIVGMMFDRSFEMIVGIFAVLKAGGAYLPIDPDYPEDRINYMLSDSQTSILLTQQHLKDQIKFNGEILNIEEELFYTGDSTNLEIMTQPTDLAYIIYTSGSTGKPKGVMIEHRSVVNLLTALNRKYTPTENDTYLLKTAYTFDVSLSEIFGWILGNGKLVILKKDGEKDPTQICRTIDRYGVTHINFVPSMLNVFLKMAVEEDLQALSKLKYVFAAGEAISTELVKKFYQLINGVTLENLYGPTESTIYSTQYPLTDLRDETNVPIGKPLQNIQTYILNEFNQLQPIGVSGELCLAGTGLARGYLNRRELTDEKFVENPFKARERMYKTGDLVRWLPDGNIEFLGRIDHQVKIRGFRIELGEIEKQLLNHDSIQEVVVVDLEDENQNNYLCGYFVSAEELVVADLRTYLAKGLPDYMIPSYFVKLDKIPLSANGKIDRKALPKTDGSQVVATEYVAPRNELEERMATIWAEVLSVEKVGIYDNFFELGGHSIKATYLVYKISNEFDVELSLIEFFVTPTIKDLVQKIENKERRITEVYDHVVLLRRGKDKTKNLFLIHDGSGTTEGYLEFSNYSKTDFNYWGINSDLPNAGLKNITIKEIAVDYIAKIKKIQPEGPYYIAGWSIGGTIAFEIVKQLENLQDEVKQLVLFDSPAPTKDQIHQSEFTVETELEWLQEIVGDNEIIEKLNKAKDLEELWMLLMNFVEAENLNVEMVSKAIPDSLAKPIPNFDQLEITELLYRVNVVRALSQARMRYLPAGQIKTQVHFIKAKDTNRLNHVKWNEYCQKLISSEEIEGDHYSIFKLPNVIQLANSFDQMFQQNMDIVLSLDEIATTTEE